ncbi:MAG: LamG-like jellyroll fold domain-containing protein, partial [Cyanobacteriota bacterium SKYGB_h_bin112]|nr:LamG-like jellyroll fold domain-containing protein [Cyanobacteriota bacterium SKYGB_h_bin112]
MPASLIVEQVSVDLAVEKRIANLPWQVGGTGQFTILVSNNGPSSVAAGTQITITDSIPTGMTYTGFSGQGWNCMPQPPASGPVTVTCTYTLTSNLSANQTLPFLSLTVQPTAPGGFENCVAVEAPVSDPNPANNQKCREGEIIDGAGTEVCIVKFEDFDGDGQRDPNEQGLGGWVFQVNPSNISPAPPLTTGSNGQICFKVISPGTYTITEQVQPGWTPTTPNPQTFTVQAGQSITVLFGNKKQCVQPPSGLIEWWPLDETSGTVVNNLIPHPISGHGPDLHNGTSNPGAIGGTGPAPIAGMVGGALQFDGTDDFIEVSDGAGTLSHGNPTSNFTIDAWVKVNPGDASGVRPIVDKRFDFPDSQNPNVHTRGYAFYLYNGRLGFQIADDIAGLSQMCDAGPPFTANCTNYVSTGPNIADGQWHHVAVTVQRTGTPEIRLYVDGNVVLT